MFPSWCRSNCCKVFVEALCLFAIVSVRVWLRSLSASDFLHASAFCVVVFFLQLNAGVHKSCNTLICVCVSQTEEEVIVEETEAPVVEVRPSVLNNNVFSLNGWMSNVNMNKHTITGNEVWAQMQLITFSVVLAYLFGTNRKLTWRATREEIGPNTGK